MESQANQEAQAQHPFHGQTPQVPDLTVRGLKHAEPTHRRYPIDDAEAYLLWGEQFGHVFDRFLVARAQGLMAGPHGIVPPRFPVYSKPIVNLVDRGAGARKLTHWTPALYRPGHFWMEALEGQHLSTDYVIVNGAVVWRYQVEVLKDYQDQPKLYRGAPAPARRLDIEEFMTSMLEGYTGVANVETIGPPTVVAAPTGPPPQGYPFPPPAYVLELHLRAQVEMAELYGPAWWSAVHQLYANPAGGRALAFPPGQAGVCIPLRAAHELGELYAVSAKAAEQIDALGLHLEFQPNEPIAAAVHDEFTYRLARVADPDLAKAKAAASALAELIRPLQPRKGKPVENVTEVTA